MRVTAMILTVAFSASTAMALETSAGANAVQSTQVGLAAKLDASNALLKTAIDELTNRIKVCSAKTALYNPGGAGADADGCVVLSSASGGITGVTTSAEFSAKQKQTKTVGTTSSWNLCVLEGLSTNHENHSCRVYLSGASWILQGSQFTDSSVCYARCYKFTN